MDITTIMLSAVGVFALCFALVYGLCALIHWIRHRKKHNSKQATKQVSPTAQTQKRFKIGTMDVTLIVIAVELHLFVCKMIQLFETYGSVPDTLITCVFAICGGECGAMSWIQTTKTKVRDRKWELEDRQAAKDDSDPSC